MADVGAHALLAGEGFQAAALSAVAQRAFRIQHHMAVFGSLELMPCEEGSVQDQAAAQAGADEEADNIFISAGGAEVVFTQHAQVHVVAHIKRYAELLAHCAGHVIVPPGKIRREKHDAVVLVNDAGSFFRSMPDSLIISSTTSMMTFSTSADAEPPLLDRFFRR